MSGALDCLNHFGTTNDQLCAKGKRGKKDRFAGAAVRQGYGVIAEVPARTMVGYLLKDSHTVHNFL